MYCRTLGGCVIAKNVCRFVLFAALFSSQVLLAGSTVKIKNFREIYSSYSNLMSVPANDPDLSKLFNDLKDRLPKNGTAQELNSPAVTALIELSATFCQKAIDVEKRMSFGERTLFRDIDFNKPLKQVSDYSVETTARNFSHSFWQREIKADEIREIQKLVSEIGKNKMDSVPDTTKAMKALCINFSTSLAFLVKN